MTNLWNKNKAFIIAMFSIAIPITIQNLISSSLNLIDNLMIGKLNETAIAAVAIPNQVFFLFVLIAFGVNSGTGIFISQFWGKKDLYNIKRVLGIAIFTGSLVAFLFTVVSLTIPEFIISLFVDDLEVINLASKYLKIVSLSFILTAIGFSYSFASRSIGLAKLPMIASIIALTTNTVLNYLLIFGKFGFPSLGVEGAAIATLISRIIELIIIVGYIYTKDKILNAKLREMLDLNKVFISKFFETTKPVILNEAFWALGMTMYMVAYGTIGKKAVTSVHISNTIQNLFMVVSMGLGNACAVMIGNKLGANEEKEAISYAKKFSVLGITVGISIGLILILLSPIVLKFFNVSSEVYSDSLKVLIIMGIFMVFKVFNTVLIIGILRSGGDTIYSLMLEIGSVWVIGVPLSFIGATLLKLPIYWVITLVHLEEIVKAVIGLKRIISKKWVKNIVNDI